jgi:hypothetical protein
VGKISALAGNRQGNPADRHPSQASYTAIAVSAT